MLAAFGFWLQYASPIREILNSYAASLSAIYLIIVVGFFLVAYGKEYYQIQDQLFRKRKERSYSLQNVQTWQLKKNFAKLEITFFKFKHSVVGFL